MNVRTKSDEQRAREEAQRLLRGSPVEKKATTTPKTAQRATAPKKKAPKTTKPTKPARRQPAMASKKEASANLAKGRAVSALMKTGMSKEDARKAIGLDGQHHHEEHHDHESPKRRPGRPPRETVQPTSDGSGITAGHGGALRAYVHAHTVLQYNERELGAILEGFVRAMREPTGPDTSSMFPPPMAPEALAQWRELAQERELGRQLFKHIGKAIVHFSLTDEEWRSVFARIMRDMYPDGRGVVVPFAGASAGSSGADRGVWLSPLTISSDVTDIFNRVRDDGTVHKGVDLKAPVGTLVVAPRRGRIAKVGFDEEGGGGRYLHLVVERPDGSIPMDEFGKDDSGWRMSFAHLSDVIVKEGDLVDAGQAIARSGDTGKRQTGPHLHMSLQWFIDNKAINERIFVDPLSVIPLEVIRGTAPPRPVMSQQTRIAPAVLESSPGSKGGESVSVSIGGDGNLIFNNGTAVQVAPKANLPVHLPIPFTGAGADDVLAGLATDFFGPGAAPPVRPMSVEGGASLLKSLPEQLFTMGGKALEGVGNFAGKAFQILTSPQGLRGAGSALGGATSLLGAAAGVGGAVASTVGPLLVGWIPYVGPALAAAAEVVGPVAAAASPILAGAGQAISGAANLAGQAQRPPQPTQPPHAFDLEFFGLGKPGNNNVMPV